MNLRKPYHLPYGVMTDLASGKIDHIVYRDNSADLHMADGSVQTISVEVTDEIIEAERRAYEEQRAELIAQGKIVAGQRVSMTFEVRRRGGTLIGWTK